VSQPPYSPFGGPNPVDGPTPPPQQQPPQQQWGAPPPPQPGPQGGWQQPPPQQPQQAPQQQFGQQYGPQFGQQPFPQPGFTPTPPKRNRKALFITGGATLAVLLVVGIVVAIVSFSGSGPSGIGGGGATTADGAVKGYLEALSKGDANAALAFGSDQPAAKDFLTDDILKQQVAKWPITNVRILSAGEMGDTAQVHVAANFGDQTSDQTLTVKKDGGSWKLSAAAVKLNLGGLASTVPMTDPVSGKPVPSAPITLFGKPVTKTAPVYVFPGWLDLGSGSKYLTVSTARPVLLDGLALQAAAMPTGVQVQLSDAGSEAAKQAVADSIAKCAQSTALSPPGCPNSMPNPTLVDGTAHWEAPADLSSLKYTFTTFDLTIRTIGTSQWTLTATSSSGGTVQGKPLVPLMGQIDMTQDPLTVKWYGR